METLGAKKETGDGWASWTIDAGPGRWTHTDLSKLQASSLGRKKMARVRSNHNNLLNYFICDKRDLSPTYVRKCEKYLEEISRKRQAASFKRQAASALKRTQL